MEDDEYNNKSNVNKYLRIIDNARVDVLNKSIQGNVGLLAHFVEVEYKLANKHYIIATPMHECNIRACHMQQLYVKVVYTTLGATDIANSIGEVEGRGIDSQFKDVTFMTQQEFITATRNREERMQIGMACKLLSNLFVCKTTGCIHACGEAYCGVHNSIERNGVLTCRLTGMVLCSAITSDMEWFQPQTYGDPAAPAAMGRQVQVASANKQYSTQTINSRKRIIMTILTGLLFSETRQKHELALLMTRLRAMPTSSASSMSIMDAEHTAYLFHRSECFRSGYFQEFPAVNAAMRHMIVRSINSFLYPNIPHTCVAVPTRKRAFQSLDEIVKCKHCDLVYLFRRYDECMRINANVTDEEEEAKEHNNNHNVTIKLQEMADVVLRVWNNIETNYNAAVERRTFRGGAIICNVPKFTNTVISIIYMMKTNGLTIPQRRTTSYDEQTIFVIPCMPLAKYLPPENTLEAYGNDTGIKGLRGLSVSKVFEKLKETFKLLTEVCSPVDLEVE